MSFVVVWDPEATDDIDSVWESASESEWASLVESLQSVEQLLQLSPNMVGESRGTEDERVAFFTPLAVFYRIDRVRSLVRVFAVAVSRRR